MFKFELFFYDENLQSTWEKKGKKKRTKYLFEMLEVISAN